VSVAGKVANVTGGSCGIDRVVVLGLVASGAKVAFTYPRRHEAADTLCREVRKLGGGMVGFQQDEGSQINKLERPGTKQEGWSGVSRG
jgi:NAD(P)-dependent dehydrogenase (short-subunit alcohol dehydrogenase family)